jgi:hypothetical protein
MGLQSCRVKDLQPASTKFFAISIPREPAPDRNMLAADYLATASTPIAPMYLLHLSLTASSSMSISCFFPDSVLILLEPSSPLSSSLSLSMSISFKSAFPSVIAYCFFLPCFYCYLFFSLRSCSSMSEGRSSLLSSSSSSIIAAASISLNFVFVALN